jgi:ribose transport system ATP-binding protein
VARLRVTGLVKRFGPTRALDGASFHLEPGEVHALVGENGAGKSTLLNIVAGDTSQDEGEMWVEGAPYRPQSPRDARAAGVALVHQELSLFPHLSVTDNILVGLEQHRGGWLDASANRARAREVLRLLGHDDIDPDQRVQALPIAARQVVEICRAVAADARILLLDEPTSSLPGRDVERLFEVVRRLAATGVGVVYISHVLEEVRQVASRLTILRDGRTVAGGPVAEFPDEAVVTQMAGRRIDRFFPARGHRPSDDLVLEVGHLSVPPGLIDASLQLRRGEIFGIAGLVGSGRSLLLRTLFGLVRARGGQVGVTAGRRVGHPGSDLHVQPSQRIAQGIGYLSEDRRHEGLAVAMSIADNTTLTDLHRCARAGFIDRARQIAQARTLLDRVGARAPDASLPVRTLSGGNQQKVATARLLHQRARILLLDEPTRGIDVASKAQIYETIAGLADEGCAVLVTSSSLPELFGLCDRLAVMRRGVLSPARDVSTWTEHAVLEHALGLAGGAGQETPAP